MGLNPHRDRLCVVQLSPGDGTADVCRSADKAAADAPNLKALLANPTVTKIFHFARFDVAALYNAFGVMPPPVYCTKIASRLTRTYTDRHGLKDLVRELLGHRPVEAAAIVATGARETLSEAQLAYAASDVLHLHAPAGAARRHAGARGPHRAGAGLFRIPADAGKTRFARLGYRGYFCAFMSGTLGSLCRGCRPVSVTLVTPGRMTSGANALEQR